MSFLGGSVIAAPESTPDSICQDPLAWPPQNKDPYNTLAQVHPITKDSQMLLIPAHNIMGLYLTLRVCEVIAQCILPDIAKHLWIVRDILLSWFCLVSQSLHFDIAYSVLCADLMNIACMLFLKMPSNLFI